MVGVAQLVRAPGCGPGGRRFKSGFSPHFLLAQKYLFVQKHKIVITLILICVQYLIISTSESTCVEIHTLVSKKFKLSDFFIESL